MRCLSELERKEVNDTQRIIELAAAGRGGFFPLPFMNKLTHGFIIIGVAIALTGCQASETRSVGAPGPQTSDSEWRDTALPRARDMGCR